MGLAHLGGEVFTGFANVFSFSPNVFTVFRRMCPVFRTAHVSSGSLNTQSERRGARFGKAARNGVGGNPWTAVGSGRSATVPDQR